MKSKIIYILILLCPLLDGFSTFLMNDGILNYANEMNPFVQLFGLNFKGFSIVLFMEIVILSVLFFYYGRQKEKPMGSYRYKLLKTPSVVSLRKRMDLRSGVPIFISIILSGHFIASVNNFALFFYKRRIFTRFVDIYVDFVHVQGRIYIIYILIVMFSVIITYFLGQRYARG